MTLKTQAIALAALAPVMFFGGLTGCQKKANLNDDQGKASYAIGQQIGKSLKMQNADVNMNSLVAGMQDAIDAKDSKLKPEEMQAALQKMQESAMKKQMEAAEVNQKKGDEFLAANKAKAGWKETASGLQYQVVTEGAGEMPKDTDTVKVHYTGTLTTGEKFDSSRDRNEPAEFPVNGVIPGWTEALKLMKKGARYNLVIPSKLAYGPQGRPGIPPNSVLLFDVELLDIKAAAAAPAAAGAAPGKGKKK